MTHSTTPASTPPQSAPSGNEPSVIPAETPADPWPAVHDEAGDSPRWLPMLGLFVLLLVGAVMAARASLSPAEGGATAPPLDSALEQP